MKNLLHFLAESATVASPLTPSELLIALHGIESKSDMKAVMKGEVVFSFGLGLI